MTTNDPSGPAPQASPTAPAVRKILALGDSVMWGQGLREAHKFVNLVRADLAATAGAEPTIASLARSGAIVDAATRPPVPTESWLFGELPRTYPGILTQLAITAQEPGFGDYLSPNSWDTPSWKDTKAEVAQEIASYSQAPPDLVLVDGGANDFKALQIVIPWNLHDGETPGSVSPNARIILEAAEAARTAASLEAHESTAGLGAAATLALPALDWLTDDEFRRLIDRFVFERMRTLLAALGPAFPSARVVVTAYYPIFTQGSLGALAGLPPAFAALLSPAGHGANPGETAAALLWAAGLKGKDAEKYTNWLVARSALWASYGAKKLGEAVAEANARFGSRFAMAVPVFGPENGALAGRPYLWTFTKLADSMLREILRLFVGGRAAEPMAEPAAEAFLDGALNAAAFATGNALGFGLATDEVRVARRRAALAYYFSSSVGRNDPDTSATTGFKTAVASVGHPNPAGSRAFAQAIRAALSWLGVPFRTPVQATAILPLPKPADRVEGLLAAETDTAQAPPVQEPEQDGGGEHQERQGLVLTNNIPSQVAPSVEFRIAQGSTPDAPGLLAFVGRVTLESGAQMTLPRDHETAQAKATTLDGETTLFAGPATVSRTGTLRAEMVLEGSAPAFRMLSGAGTEFQAIVCENTWREPTRFTLERPNSPFRAIFIVDEGGRAEISTAQAWTVFAIVNGITTAPVTQTGKDVAFELVEENGEPRILA